MRHTNQLGKLCAKRNQAGRSGQNWVLNRDAGLVVLGVVPPVAASGRDIMMERLVFKKPVCVEAGYSGSGRECRTQKLAADGGRMLRWVLGKLQKPWTAGKLFKQRGHQ